MTQAYVVQVIGNEDMLSIELQTYIDLTMLHRRGCDFAAISNREDDLDLTLRDLVIEFPGCSVMISFKISK
jgi:hypothetical protein